MRVERVTELCVKRETIKIETKMKKQMKRTVYEAPVTELFRVELEGNFCASVIKEDNHTIDTGGHQIEDIAQDKIDEWNSASNPWT